MKELGHLQVYDLILKTRTPLFVGSGNSLGWKRDPYDERTCYL